MFVNKKLGGIDMDTFKKIIKIVAIVAVIAAAVAGVVVAIKKFKEKKCASSEENYVSCSCCEACAK